MQHGEHRKKGNEIADLILKFYAAYGSKDEGPKNLEESTLVADAFPAGTGHLREELKLIARLIKDDELITMFASCRSTVEEIANAASAGQLLEEMVANTGALAIRSDRLSNGVFWYTLAAQIANLAKQEPPLLLLPTKQKIDPLWYIATQVIGSQVLMAYIGLVYMRSDEVGGALQVIDKQRFPILGLYAHLLRNELLRHVRNALAHGNIETTVVGLRFTDHSFDAIATPGFLQGICTWMLVFFTTALAVCTKQQETESIH